MKWMRIIENILLDVIIFIMSIAVIGIIIGAMQFKIYNQSYVDILGYSLFKVETGSMKDTIDIGDIIIIKLTKDVKENDIITYIQNKEFITHRIQKIDNDTIITKGDNNNSEDDPITMENVIGKVVYIIKNVRIWEKVCTDKAVIITVSISISMMIILATYKMKIGDN